MNGFPMSVLGGRATSSTVLEFGVLLPWVSPANGQSVEVLVIHERDQFMQDIPAVSIALEHSVDPAYGDLWTGQVDMSAPVNLPAGDHWGQAGRYVYRIAVTDPRRGRIDWVIDPYARDFAVGRQSAVVLQGQAHTWSVADKGWQVPTLSDLVMYEINVAEFNGDFDGALQRLDYLADLGVNCLSLMPVTNIADEVDWGYLPVGYFGVDERLGGDNAFKAFVDAAHERSIAVIVDAVYGHASRGLFAYQYLYDRLGYDENPFMGPFAKDYFAAQGASVDYTRRLVRDFFEAVNLHWLHEFHVDGFRYDCVPNFWDGPLGVGYAKLAFDTYAAVRAATAVGELTRFDVGGTIRLIQCAEQLEDPIGILRQSYSNATWQNTTLDASRAVARGEPGAIDRFGHALGLAGFPTQVGLNGETFDRTALQYLETHDHSRLLAEFGTVQPDEAANYLFLRGDRVRWYKLQPYLIGLLTAKGIPMLFAGEELGEAYTLPGNGLGRVGLLRPVTWDYFYDDAGRMLVTLVRKLLRLRHQRSDLRRGGHFFYSDPANLQNRGVMMFRRNDGAATTVVALNFTDQDVTVPFTMPVAGTWTEHLHGGDVTTGADGFVQLVIPSNYGRVWTFG